MMSEVEERPRFVKGSYRWHTRQWVNVPSMLVDSSHVWMIVVLIIGAVEIWKVKLNFRVFNCWAVKLPCCLVQSIKLWSEHSNQGNYMYHRHCSLILTFLGIKEVHYTLLSRSQVLSSQHFPSGLREKHFANISKKHASTVSHQILNHRQPKLYLHYCH